MNRILKYKEEIISSGLIITCLFLLILFPTSLVWQSALSLIAFLFVIPFLYGKIILKKKRTFFLLSLGKPATGFLWFFLSLVSSLVLFFIFYTFTSFPKFYTMPAYIVNNFWNFVFYEIVVVGSVTLLYEFFFRGFVMNIFQRSLSHFAIIVQFVVFLLTFTLIIDFDWTIVPYFITCLFAGFTAYYSRSILYSFLLSWFFIVIVDVILIRFS